jgi:hypothetical protein
LVVLLAAAAAYSQETNVVEYGLPGWGMTNEEAIVKMAIIKVDLTMSFVDAVRYINERKDALRIAAAYSQFERIPEPEPEYDEEGFLIVEEPEPVIVKPMFALAVDQIKRRVMLYLSMERGTKLVEEKKPAEKTGEAGGAEAGKETEPGAAPAGEPKDVEPKAAPDAEKGTAEKPADEAGEADGEAGAEAGAEPSAALEPGPRPVVKKEVPFVKVILWRLRPDGIFYHYAVRTYAPMARPEIPESVKILEAFFQKNPTR